MGDPTAGGYNQPIWTNHNDVNDGADTKTHEENQIVLIRIANQPVYDGFIVRKYNAMVQNIMLNHWQTQLEPPFVWWSPESLSRFWWYIHMDLPLQAAMVSNFFN